MVILGSEPVKWALIASVVVVLSACASTKQPREVQKTPNAPSNSDLIRGAVTDTGKSLPSAAAAPLRDLNLIKTDIPEILLRIEYPYKIDGPVYCDQLVTEVTALDQVLGLGQDHFKADLTRNEKAAEAASNAAQNALSDAATGWIPYRSILRRVTGATKHERAVRAAFERGRIRRAFLKGVGGAFQCPYPARPSSVNQPVLAPDNAMGPKR